MELQSRSNRSRKRSGGSKRNSSSLDGGRCESGVSGLQNNCRGGIGDRRAGDC